MSKKSLPSLRYLTSAAESLPDADLWPDDNYTVLLKKQCVELSFRKIKLSQSRDGSTHRWIYEGKVIVK
jgi:hypothetical protein